MIRRDRFNDDTFRVFVRKTARRVAKGDASLADDIEQYVHLAVMEGRSESIANVRGWVRAVATNYVRMQARADWSRPRHESLAVEPESTSGEPIDGLLRHEEGAELRDRLARLDPRFQEVLLLRFVEELPPRAVAAKLGIPVNTVRSRTQRAVEALQQLYPDRRPVQKRNSWVVALLGAWRRRRPALGWGGLALVSGLIVWLGISIAGTSGPGQAHDAGAGLELSREVAALDESQGARASRTAVDSLPTGGGAAPAPAPTAVPRRLRVVGPAGKPAAAVDVFGARDPFSLQMNHVGKTDAAGELTLPMDGMDAWFSARGDVGFISPLLALERGAGQTTLTLDEVPVAWVDVDLGLAHGADLSSAILATDPARTADIVRMDPEHGVAARPIGVPPWTDGAQRVAVRWPPGPKHLVLIEDGQTLWRSRRYRNAEAAPTAAAPRLPWTLRGRIVSRLGDPIAAVRVTVSEEASQNGHRCAAESDSDGYFELRVPAWSQVAVRASGSTAEVSPPSQAGTVVEIGDFRVRRVSGSAEASGYVKGVRGRTGVRYVTKSAASSMPSIRVVQRNVRCAEVELDASDAFVVPHASRDIAAMIVDVEADGETYPWIIPWDLGRWKGDRIEVEGPAPKPARITLPDADLIPDGEVLYVHRGSRVFFTVKLEMQPDGSALIVLPPGEGEVGFRSESGRIVRWTMLELSPGSNTVVEDPTALEVDLSVDWGPVLEAGAPDDEVEVHYGGAVDRFAVELMRRDELPNAGVPRRAPGGQHVVAVRDASGRTWCAAAYSKAGRSLKLDLIPRGQLLRIDAPWRALTLAAGPALFRVIDAQGNLAGEVELGSGRGARATIAVPPGEPWTVETTIPRLRPLEGITASPFATVRRVLMRARKVRGTEK